MTTTRQFKLHGLDRQALDTIADRAQQKGGQLSVLHESRVGTEPEFLVSANDTAILELLSDHSINLAMCTAV